MSECESIVRASCSLGFEEADVSQVETASSEREPSMELGEVRRGEIEWQVSLTGLFSAKLESDAWIVGLDGEEPMVAVKSTGSEL